MKIFTCNNCNSQYVEEDAKEIGFSCCIDTRLKESLDTLVVLRGPLTRSQHNLVKKQFGQYEELLLVRPRLTDKEVGKALEVAEGKIVIFATEVPELMEKFRKTGYQLV